MPTTSCSQCGACYEASDESCFARFDLLLALDHSHTEPWGSRHGQAFAAFTLQHPESQTTETLERCWAMLCRIYVSRDDPADVIRAMRRAGARTPLGWTVTGFPGRHTIRGAFGVTIADLGAFDAAEYAGRLDAWCESTLAGYGIELRAG